MTCQEAALKRRSLLDKSGLLARMKAKLDSSKEEAALRLIGLALKKAKKPVVAFSGGKDSTTVLDLVRRVRPDVPAVFENTGIESHHTLDYVKTVENVKWLTPRKTFWECVELFGWPKPKQANGGKHGNSCCHWLKDKPMMESIKADGWDLIFTGLTGAESHHRHLMLRHLGPLYFAKTWNTWKCHPIHDWSPDDVWGYIGARRLPYNHHYDPPTNGERCGCLLCTAYSSWEERLPRENMKAYNVIMRKMGRPTQRTL